MLWQHSQHLYIICAHIVTHKESNLYVITRSTNPFADAVHEYTYVHYTVTCHRPLHNYTCSREIFQVLLYNDSSSLTVDMFRPSGTLQYNPKFPKTELQKFQHYASRFLNQNNNIIIHLYNIR